jgi:predicted ATPase/DNA-binding winged helix-turn-helix (wHTH) protein
LNFGPFLLDVGNARLSRDGAWVDLTPKSFELLAFLAQRPGQLVLKDQLLDAVWGRRFVSEGAVKTVVSELRAALGDDPRAPRWIETVQRRGYRFCGEVTRAASLPQGADRDGSAAVDALRQARLGNVAAAPPDLIAREAELTTLGERLRGRRLITLTGVAGVGKTRLAQRAAWGERERFVDGAWWIELAPLAPESTDRATLRSTLAHGLQLAPAAAASDESLVRTLAPMSMLVVLDNAEHLLATLAPLVELLHAQAPQLHLLITSREPLQIAPEQVLRLAPLALPEPGAEADASRLMACGAVRLFVDRVATRLSGFELGSAQLGAVARLCRALDGLPLALELAAARVPILGINGLAERLADGSDGGARLQLLTQGARTASPHQRTLRAALDWSHALLTPAQQRVFRRLAVFRGGFTLESAQIVCADDELDAWAVLDALNALVEKSMLTAPATVPAPGPGAPRFTQLESLHEYAHELWRAAGEEEATRRRHLRASVRYWEAADARSLEEGALSWVEAHAPEIDNLRSALHWAGSPGVRSADREIEDDWLSLLGYSSALWHRAGIAVEGTRWALMAQPVAMARAEPRLRGGACLTLATLSCYSTALPHEQGAEVARQAAAAFQQAGDPVREYYAHYLACMQLMQGQHRGDRTRHLARMAELLQPGWSSLLRRFWRGADAYERRMAGDAEAYLSYARAELAQCRQDGALWEAWVAAHALILAEADRDQPQVALALADELIAEIRVAGRLHQNATRLALWVLLTARHRSAEDGRAAIETAMPVLRASGSLGIGILGLAWLAHHEGRARTAAMLLGWFDGPHGAGNAYGPGTYSRRSVEALWSSVAGLGDGALRAGLARRGSKLAEDAALSLGLGHEDAPAGEDP